MPTTYQRAPERVKAQLVERDDGGIYTKVPCKIQVPERYLGRHLASVGNETHILGFYALIMEDSYYAVSVTNAMMRITPSSMETVVVDGVNYLEFGFDAGSRVIYSSDLVMSATLTYYIYDEHISKGRIPWYFNYFDLARLFDTAQEFAGINLGNRAILDLIISTIARDSEDKTRLYRHRLTSAEDVVNHPPTIVPFKSVIWNTADTTSRLIGAYFTDSINSALINPSDRVERIEQLLRT